MSLLQHQAQRQRTKELLTVEIGKLQKEIEKALHQEATAAKAEGSVGATASAVPKCYEVKLNNYGWDQSENFVKLYVTLKNVHTLAPEAVSCKFTNCSMNLKVFGLENRNYDLPINNLCEEIDESKSYIKVKTDLIVIFLAKKVKKNWSHVTGVEKKIKEAKTVAPSDMDKGEDPEASIMNIMKKMYQEGDDNMKKVIAKAWTESEEKKKNPNM